MPHESYVLSIPSQFNDHQLAQLATLIDARLTAHLADIAALISTLAEPWDALSRKEAALKLGHISTSTLSTWVQQHGLPDHKIDGRVLFLSDELHAWVAAQAGTARGVAADDEAAA